MRQMWVLRLRETEGGLEGSSRRKDVATGLEYIKGPKRVVPPRHSGVVYSIIFGNEILF